MTRIAYLACPETLPAALGGFEARRGDAFEHDLMVAALRPAFVARGFDLVEIDWHAPLADFDGFALALIGTTWDYQDHAGEFLAKLRALETAGIAVCNAPSQVEWNIEKTYLRELADRGAQTIPTLWPGAPGARAVREAFDALDCDRVVVKRQVGGGALGQQDFTRDAPPSEDWQFGHPAMIQPFLPAIETEGELSFVFIDGAFNHAIRKTPAKGEYRIQSLYGGREEAIRPSAADIDAAGAIVAAMPGEAPLYARIDMLRGENGGLVVMEAEAIEPYLYPEQGPDLGPKLADAIARRLNSSN